MVFEKVCSLLAKQFNLDESTITMDSSIRNDIGADSLDALDMLMDLEEEFDINIPDREADATVGKLVLFIESETAAKMKKTA